MRWLVGWNGASAVTDPGLRELRPLGGQLLWGGPDPLWAVGDWRPEEIRTISVHRQLRLDDTVRTGFPDLPEDPDDPAAADGAVARLAVVGHCGAGDAALRTALLTASGGALHHLTAWPGSYVVVLQQGTRTTLIGDLAGVRPLFHTQWCGGTAFATAALPLADLVGAPVDPLYLAARLAVPDAPEAVDGGSPFAGVRRVPPGRALSIRAGRPQLQGYEPQLPAVGGSTEITEAAATGEVTRSLLEAVRCRVRGDLDRPHRVSTDLSGGSASTVVTLLAAAIPTPPARRPPPPLLETLGATAPGPGGFPAAQGQEAILATSRSVDERWGDPRSYRTLHHGPPTTLPTPARSGAIRGSWARGNGAASAPDAPLLAVTYTDGASADPSPDPARTAELVRVRSLAGDHPRLEHLLIAGGPDTLPYADLLDPDLAGPLTDEPGAALVAGARHRRRLAEAGTDHLGGHGGRQVLDGHPARLADLLLEHRRLPLLRPITALARADSTDHPVHGAFGTPVSVLRAARRLARTSYAEGLEDAATQLMSRHVALPGTAGAASIQSLSWCDPGPAARWLTDDALSAVSVRLRLATRRTAPDERPGARRARLALHRQAGEFRVLTQLAEEAHGQRLHAPYLDSQVVRACGLVPPSARVQPGSRHAILRSVLAGAGAESVPDWGSTPPDPYSAADSVREGLRRALSALDRIFAAPLLADLGLLDARAFRKALHNAARDRPVPLDGLAAVVSTEVWLRRLHARQGSCWTGMPLAERRAIGGLDPIGVP